MVIIMFTTILRFVPMTLTMFGLIFKAIGLCLELAVAILALKSFPRFVPLILVLTMALPAAWDRPRTGNGPSAATATSCGRPARSALRSVRGAPASLGPRARWALTPGRSTIDEAVCSRKRRPT